MGKTVQENPICGLLFSKIHITYITLHLFHPLAVKRVYIFITANIMALYLIVILVLIVRLWNETNAWLFYH